MEKYIKPKSEEFILDLEKSILAASVVVDDNFESVQTMGQEVVEIDASCFTSNWE